jgi:hypothetical protein
MFNIIQLINIMGLNLIYITPLTLVMGIIYGIKKPDNEARPYIIMAVISAYLIIIPLLFY